MPDIDYWRPILKERGYSYYNEPHDRQDKTPEHKCNPFQFIALNRVCANDDNRACDFKVTILAHDVVKIECFAYRDNYWETCFHGKISTGKHFEVLMNAFIGHVIEPNNRVLLLCCPKTNSWMYVFGFRVDPDEKVKQVLPLTKPDCSPNSCIMCQEEGWKSDFKQKSPT